MKIQYTGPFDAVAVPLPSGIELTVERDGFADVPDELASRLCEQDIWTIPPDKNPSKTAAKPAEGS